jgi:hypothetical protein
MGDIRMLSLPANASKIWRAMRASSVSMTCSASGELLAVGRLLRRTLAVSSARSASAALRSSTTSSYDAALTSAFSTGFGNSIDKKRSAL